MIVDLSKTGLTGVMRVREASDDKSPRQVTGPAQGNELAATERILPDGKHSAAHLTEAQVEKVAAGLRQYAQEVEHSLDFEVSSDSGVATITVRDPNTGKVIREISPEEVRDILTKATEPRIMALKV